MVVQSAQMQPDACVYVGVCCVQVQDYLEPFRLSLEKLQEVSARLRKDLVRGLGKHSHHRAAVKMLPTFVRATPDGTGEAGYLFTDIFLLYVVVVYIKRRHIWGHESGEKKVIKTNMIQVFFPTLFTLFVDRSVVSPGRERRLPGVGSRWYKLPSASCPSGGGGAEDAEDGQSDLRHPTGDDAGNRRTGDTNKMNKQSDSRKQKQENIRGRNEKQKYEIFKWVNK